METRESLRLKAVSEVYSLFSVLYFLVTEKVLPDYGTSNLKSISYDQKLAIIADGHQSSLDLLKNEIPGSVVEVFADALVVDPSHRASSASELSDRIRTLT